MFAEDFLWKAIRKKSPQIKHMAISGFALFGYCVLWLFLLVDGKSFMKL